MPSQKFYQRTQVILMATFAVLVPLTLLALSIYFFFVSHTNLTPFEGIVKADSVPSLYMYITSVGDELNTFSVNTFKKYKAGDKIDLLSDTSKSPVFVTDLNRSSDKNYAYIFGSVFIVIFIFLAVVIFGRLSYSSKDIRDMWNGTYGN